jgi:hypothetical protein
MAPRQGATPPPVVAALFGSSARRFGYAEGARAPDLRAMSQRSVAVILNVSGAVLDADALTDLPLARLVRAEFARGERAGCVAATLDHECDSADLAAALRRWAAGRGWSVTVAPLSGGR